MIVDKKKLATKEMMAVGFIGMVRTKKGKQVTAFIQGGMARISYGLNSVWQSAELISVTTEQDDAVTRRIFQEKGHVPEELNQYYTGPRVVLTEVIATGGIEGDHTIKCRDNAGRIHHMVVTGQFNVAELHHAQQEIDRLYMVGGDPLVHVVNH